MNRDLVYLGNMLLPERIKLESLKKKIKERVIYKLES